MVNEDQEAAFSLPSMSWKYDSDAAKNMPEPEDATLVS